MNVVSILKSRAHKERELLFKPPDYKLVEEAAAERIETLENLIKDIKSWYTVQNTSDQNLEELGKILKL
jgi:hypothetical protein